MIDQEAKRTIVLGMTGGGKSVITDGMTANDDRAVFYDTQCQDFKKGVIFYDFKEFKRYWLKHYKSKFRIIFRPDDPQAYFPEFCKLVWACKNLTMVTEEMSLLIENGKACPEFKKIIYQGRKEGIKFVGVTQRPRGIGKDLTSQAKEWIIFDMIEPDDLAYIKGALGSYTIEQIQKLNASNYEFVHVRFPRKPENINISRYDIERGNIYITKEAC